MARGLRLICKDILCRAYYGLPVRPANGESLVRKQARSISLKACRRNQWIDSEDRLTQEGLRILLTRKE